MGSVIATICYIYIIGAYFTAILFASDEKPIKIIIGTVVLWPVILIHFIVSSVKVTLKDLFEN